MNRAARFVAILGLFVYGVFASQGVSQAQASNTWTVAGHLTQARSGAAAVLLTDGRVLITGGSDSTGIPQPTAEIYDPATGTYTASTPMNVPRANHAAIVMKSGDVLVTGGLTVGGAYSDTAEIYSVSSQQWTLLPSSIGVGLAYQAMAQLSDGNILIAGGTSTAKVVGSIVLFNLTDQTFMPIGMLQTPRTNAVAAATPDGRVLIAGGTDINGAVLASTEIFVYNKDTMTGSISSGPTMAFPRVGATATSTYDGVAVVGGNNGEIDLGTAEIFSQWTNTFKTVSGGTPRSHHFAALLPKNGSILAMGGTGGAAVDLLLPWANSKAGAFFAASESLVNQDGGFASPASLGSLLAAGGKGNYASASELYWFPTISTDKPDYAPGKPVHMTGTGFQPFENVTLHIHEWVKQSTDDDPDVTVTADSFGNFAYDGYAPDTDDLGARYHLTAVGMSSGYQAQVIFTDSIINLNFTNSPLDQATNACGLLTISSNAPGGQGPIYLTDSTTTGAFYSNSSCTGTAVTSVPGASNVSVWYKNSAPSTPTLYACSVSGGVILCFLEGAALAQQNESIYGPPTQLVFTTEPGGGTPGAVWAVQPVVAVQDANYNTVSANSDPIILTLSTNPGGTLSCASNPQNASSGSAAFSNCLVSGASSSSSCYRLTAKDTTLNFTVVSNCFYIENAANAGTSTVIANPALAVDNGNAPPNGGSTITVTLKDAGGALLGNKVVTLTAGGGNSNINTVSGTTNSSGVATFTVTDTNPEVVTYTALDVTDNIQITQTATVTFAPGPVSPTRSTVTANPTTVNADGVATSTITVTLQDSSGDVEPGKTVTLTQGGGSSVITPVSGITNSNGVVTFTVTDTHVENVTYTATDSTDSVAITQKPTVNFVASGTTLTLTINPNSISQGTTPVVLTAGLSVTSGGAGLGGVSISFRIGAVGSTTCSTSSTLLATVATDVTGTATYNYPSGALATGTYRICAFTPTPTFTANSVTYTASSASGSSFTLTVGIATTFAWTAPVGPPPGPPASAVYNTTFTPVAASPSGTGHSPCTPITYGVSGGACSINNFTHAVTMTSGGGLPPGSLTCTVTANLPACSSGFPAVFYAPATLTAVVTPVLATQATLNLLGVPASAGDGTTFTVSTSGGSGTGAVTYSTSTPTVCSVSGNQVTMNATGVTQTCTVMATKASDGNYASATSATKSAVSDGTAIVTITNTTQTFSGSPLPVTVTTAPPGLSLAVDYAAPGFCTYAGPGSCPTPPTNVGSYSVTATVTTSGVTGSQTATETVSQLSPGLVLALQTGTTNPSPYGNMAYFTLNVSTLPCPTGTVQLTVDGTNVGSTQAIGCSGPLVFSTATIMPGTHNVIVQYGGDSQHAPSQSNTLIFTVSADTTSVTLTSTTTPVFVGQSITFTATVGPTSLDPSADGPAGTVQFYDGATPLGPPQAVFIPSPVSPPFTATYTATLAQGSHSITATYVPGSGEFAGSSSAIEVAVVQYITPVLTWPAPTSIVYGTPLSVIQLNATAADPVNTTTVDGVFTYTPAANTVLGVGTTSLSVSFQATDTATYGTVPVTMTVPITITAATLLVTADNQTMPYGGPIPTLTATITGFVAGDVPSQVTGTAACTTTATLTTPVSGNPYTINCTLGTLAESNYTFTFAPGTLTETAATPTVSLGCQEVTYDGNTHSCQGVAIGADGTTPVTGNWVYSPVNETLPGSYPVTGTFTSSDPNYVTTPLTANGTLIIDIATSSVTLTCPSSVPYNGAAQTPCTATATGSGSLNVPLTPAIIYTNNTNAGTAQATVTYNGDANHTGSSNTATFAIAPVGITVTAGNYTGVYAGTTPPPIPACSIGGSGTAGLTCSESPTTAGPDVGTGTVTVTLNYNGLNPNNFTVISSTNGSWTINPATPTISVTCSPSSLPYNGSAQTPCTATVTGVGGVPLTPASLAYTNNVDAGLAMATENYAGSTDYSAGSNFANFAITAVVVTATAGDYNGPYDGSTHSPSPCVITGAAIGISTLSCTNNPPSVGPAVGGPFAIAPVVGGNTNGDFTVNLVNGSYTISKATPTITVSCPPSGVVYNGAAQTPCTATATAAGGVNLTPVSLTYTNNINVSTVAAPATANASYAGNADYAAATGTGSFTILPATVTATAGTYSGSYTGTAATIAPCTITGVSFATGLTCTNNPTQAGPGLGTAVTVTPQVSGDTGNFTINLVNGSWTINPAVETVTITGGLAQFYTGSPVAPVTTATSPVALLPVTVLYGTTANPSNPNSSTPPTAVGSYAVLATINNPDYFGSATGTLVISTANLNLTLVLHSGTAEPSLYGQSVEFDLTLTGSPCPTGTVTWTLDGLAQTPVSVPATCSGPVTFVTDTLQPGSHTLSAAYSGDGNYQAGTSNQVTHVVAVDTTTVTLAVSPTTVNVGQPITLTAVVAPAMAPGSGALVPTGTVQFYDGATAIGSPVALSQLGGSYLAISSISSLAVGPHSISATYVSSDPNEYPGSSSTVNVSVTVDKIVPNINWTAPANIVYGTALSATQLNATATDPTTGLTVPGTLVYSPIAGSVLPFGTTTLAVTFTPLASDSATYAGTGATVAITVTAATPTLLLTCPAATYNGNSQQTCVGSETGVSGGNAPTGTWSYNPASETEAGTYSVTGTFTSTNNNYQSGGTATGTLIINKAPVTATAGSYTGVYTGTAGTLTNCAVTGAYTGNLTCTNNPVSAGPGVGNLVTVSPVVSGSPQSDFTITLRTGTWTITKATSTVTVSCPGTFTYNGAAQIPCTATVTGAGGLSQPVTPVTYTNNTNAGTATASATYAGDANHAASPTASANFTISPAPVTATAGSYNAVYDGAAHATAPACAVTGAFTGTLTCTNNPATVGPAVGPAVGSGTVTPTVTGGTLTNFTITAVNGTWSITKATVTVTVSCPASVVYNGAAQTPCTANVTGAGGLSQTLTPSYTLNTNVGTATASASFAGDASHAGGSNSTTFAITAAAVTATAGSFSGVYNGAARTPSACTLTGPFTTGLSCADNPASVGPAVGLGTITPTVTGGSANFTITLANGSWSITAATPTLSVSCPAVPYNGAAHSCTGTATGIGGATVAGTWSFSPGSETNAGSYAETGTFTPSSTNYQSGIATGTLTISPVAVSATAGSLTVVYNGAAHTIPACTITGSYTTGLTCTESPTTETTVGTGAVTPTVTGGNSNFTITTHNGTWTITTATPTVSAWPTAGAITYGQTLASSTLTGGTASVAGTFAWTTPTTAPGAGTPTESVTFTPTDTTDYVKVTGSVAVTVNKATPTVSAWPTAGAITYGQTLSSSTLTGGTASVAGAFSWTTPTTAPGAGTPSESVTFTPTNTTDYNTVTGSVTVTVNKATATVTVWPTAGAITYGQTLASSTLTGGTASVAGTFSWTTPTTAPGAGTPSESVTFTPTDTADYKTAAGSVTVTVNKATATVTVWPTAGAITYGQTLSSSTLTGGTASVAGAFSWTTPTTAPGAGTPSESVTFTPTDTADYNTVTGSVTVTVNKATATVTVWPTAGAITYGQTLASSTLTGGTASVAGTFSWTTPATAPGAGTPSESVTFTPTDTADYNTATGSVTVTVNKAAPTVTAWPTAGAITYGQTLSSSTLTGGTASVAGTFAWTTPTTAPGAGTPSESVTFTPTDTADYNTVTGSATVTVNKATATVSAWPTAAAITYGQTLSSSTLTGGTASVPGTFSWTTPTTAPGAGTPSESVTFTPTDTADYNTVTGSVTVTVNKATATVSAWPTAGAITYGQTLSSSMLTGGTASVAGTFSWTTPTTAPGAGTPSESVTFTPTDTADYNTTAGSVTVTVNKATATVSAWPTAGAITVGQTLASSTLTGGTASVAGTFAWTTPTTAPGAGTPSESVTFTPTDTTDYNTATGLVTVTVSKATPTVSAWPTAGAITYGQTLSSSTLTGGTASVAGTFAWTTPTAAPGAGTPSESVTFTPSDAADYNSVTALVTVTVRKATPTVSAWPTAGAISVGQTLSSSILTGGTASVAGTFAWTTPATAPGAGTPSESVTFTPTDTTDYNAVTALVTVTVNKATPTVSAWPTAGAITYGQTLSSSTLTGGTASVAGTFAWTTPTTAPGAGTPSESVTFTPTDTADYNTVTGLVTITVSKATPTVSAWPTAGAISVGQTLSSSTLTGGTASVAGTFAWTTPATAPGAGTPSESVTFTPTDTADYNTATGSVTVTVNKATPTVSAWPTAGAITYGQTLSSSALTGGTASVAGTFAWTTPTTAPGAGTPSESVTFTPTDTTDYNTVTASVTVTVNKATPTVSAWPAAGAISVGQTLSSSTLTGGTASVAGTFAWTTPTTAPGAGTPSESVTFTPTDTTDYNTVTGSVTVTVRKATPTVSAWPTAGAITYGQTLSSSILTGGTASVAGTFAWTTPTTVPGAGTPSESVTFTPTDTTDYNTVTASVTVTVSKATPTVSAWPTAGAITIGQTLSSSALASGTASVAGTFAWTTPTTAPPLGPSSESVTFTPTDTTDYNTVTASVTVTVNNKTTPTVSAWPTAGAITYGQTLSSSTLTGGTASVAGTFTWTTPTAAPGAGTPSESVTFTPTDTADYNTATGLVTVTVSKATPTVSAWPTAGAITYGQTLSSSALTGGTASVAGTFAWTTPTTAPPLGPSSESVTFTPTDTTDYNTVIASVTVTVNKAMPTVSAWPTAGAITAGQTLSTSILTGGTASVAGTFAWTTPTTVPGAGTPSESVTFTPTDTTDYNTVTGSITVTVGKATPTVSAWPTAGSISVGQTLSSSALTGGTASVAGTFAWTTPTTAPGAGTPSESVTFTPTDTADYNTATGSITVTVSKATPTISAWPTAGAITAGQTLSTSILTGGTASVAGTFAWTTSTIAPGAGTPSESVTFTPTDTTDYNTVTASVTVTVNNKTTPTVSAWPTAGALTYGQTLSSSALSGGTASVAGTFAWTTPATAPGAGTPTESVTFTPTDTADYNTATGSITVTVSKATPTVSAWPTAGAITVGQTLSSSILTGGTASVAGTFAWTTPTTAPGAGTPSESVIFTPTDTADYNTVTASVTVTVNNKTTPTVSAWPTAGALTYGQTLSSSALSGGTASAAGTFAWTTPATTPGAGTPSESVTFTPTDTADYNTATGSVTVTVSKAAPTVSAWPTAGAITVGQTLSTSILTGGTASVAGTFAWTTPTTAPGAGTPSESVTFTPTDTANYNTVTASVTVMVNNKTTPTVTAWPTAGALTYGQTLSSSALSGGTASVAGTFAWTTPATAPGAGTPSESVTFTPTDTADYNTATGSITVTVSKATPTVSAWPTAGAITAGQTLSTSILTGGTASVAGTFAWTTPTIAPGAGTPSESVIFTPTDTANYNTVTASVTVMVNNKTTPTVTAWPTAGALTYGQTLSSSALSGGTASVAGTFAWTTPATAPGAGTPSESVTFTPTDTADYNTATGLVTVTVSKATPTVSAWPTAGAITAGQTLSTSILTGGTASVAGTFAWTTPATVPGAGTPSESVIFTPTDTADYNTVTASVTVTVNNKTTPTVSAWPTAGALTYGQTLSSSALSGGTASVAGTFAWTTPATAPGAGTPSESVTFTPTDTADYNTVTGSVTVTVNKATPTVSAWPTAGAITAGQTLSTSILAGGTASVAGTFAWTTPATVPGAGTPSESVIFTPTDTTDYNTVTASVTVTVNNKTTPTVTAWPTAGALTYGQTLSSSALTGGTASVAGTFAWTTPATAPGAGTPSESVTFTPTDTADYNTVTGSVTVTVNKATPTVSAWPTAGAITAGQTLSTSILTGGTASVAGTFAWTTPATVPGAGTPSESVIFTPTDTTDYNTVTASVTVTVNNKTTPTVTAWPTAGALTYGQTLSSSALTGGTASVAGTFAWTTPATAPGAGTPSESVTFTPTDTADYNTATGSITVTVSKATPTVSAWPTAGAITAGQTLSTSILTGGTASVAGTFAWTTPTIAPGAGTPSESVTFAPTDTANYNTVTASVTVMVNNKTTPTVTAWPTAGALTYGQTLSSSALSGGTASVAGTFAWTTPATAPGAGTPSESVTFTPTDTADYNTVTGSVTVTVSKATPTVSAWPTAGAITAGQTLSTSILAGGTASVAGTFAWTTPATVPGAGTPSESVTFTPTDTADYNTVTASVTVTVNNKTTPTVSAWPTAGALTYGQTLSSSALTGGTASVAGTFAWTTPATAPGAGTPSESVTFTPTDTADYNTATGSITVTVSKATPTVSAWPTAGAITAGQTLSTSILTGGTASVAGTFAWTTPATVPGAGTPSESVIFTPTDTTDYNTVTASVTVTVNNKTTPTVTAWPTAGALTYGQTLSSSALTGGTASVAGTFAWTTPATAPGAGTPSESVTFTPTDTADYNTATGSITVTVSKATPTVSAWPTAGAITAGQTLSTSILTGGTASVAGTFAWTTPATVPGAGTPSESVIFTPTDTTDYNTVTASVTVTVNNKTTPTVTAWPTAGALTYGQTLSSSALTGGTASVAGTFAWTTPATAPGAGTPSESVTFTPTDTADYNTATGSITVTVSKATPTVSAWPTAGAITAGQTLSTSILTGGTASVAGTFAWTTPATVPGAGTPSESVIFTPTDTTNYNTVTASVTVMVNNKTTPTVTAWPTAGALTYGQTLSSSALTGGTASVAGTFAWTTPATAPGAGTPSESVTFTPTDTADYNTVTGSVTVTVSKATPTVSAWPTAGAITAGQTLSTSILAGGTASVAGTFAWTTPATVPGAGTPSESVIFTPTDTANYNTVTASVTVTVNNKTTPTVTAWPTAGALTYGQTLSSSALTGGTASVAGTFAWTTPATAPGAGTPSESVTFTPTDTADYNTATGSITVTVSKATPTVSAWPTAGAITAGQTLSTSILTGGTASVAGTFAWTTPATVPGAGTPSESVIFTPTDTTDYNTVTASVTVTVNNKTTPTVTAWPTAGALTYGQTLSSSALTGGTASVAGTFAWTTPATAPGAGTPSESVTFTPTDTADYNTATGSITVTVSKATPTVSAWPTAGAITAGQTLSTSILTGGTASVAGTFAWTTPTIAPGAGTPSESVTFTPTDTANYNTVTASVTVTVNNKTTPTVTAWPTAGALTYGQTLSSSALSGGTASVAGTFAWTTPATAPGAGTPSESVTFTPTDTADYNTVTGSVTVTVSKATPTVSAWPTAGAITYGQTLSSSTMAGGTASVAGAFSWSTPTTAPPVGTDSETVTFTPTDTTDYNTVAGSVTVTVNKALLTVAANNASRVYGTANPTFTGSVLGTVNGDTYTESYSTVATISSNVGTYPIVPSVTGANLNDYAVAVQDGTLTITQAGTATSMNASSSSATPGQSVTLTAQVVPVTTGTPTGSVAFYDGTTLLGTVSLTAGTATMSTSSLAPGATNGLQAVYGGDNNFTTSSSSTSSVSVAPLDYTLAVSGASSLSVNRGSVATYQVTVAPLYGTYPGTVSFSANGLPTGASVAFSPSTIAIDAGKQTVTVTVQTPALAKLDFPSTGRKLAPLTFLALFLIPLIGAGRMRRQGRRLSKLASLLLLLVCTLAGAMVTGCGGAAFKQTVQNYTIQVTTTSGNMQHSASVSLQLK